MADTPDEASRSLVDEALARLDLTALQAAVPGVSEVLPVPVINAGAENYIQQADIFLGPPAKSDRAFLGERLIPAIQRITQMKAAQVVWWETPKAAAAPPPARRSAASIEQERNHSLLSSIREYFDKYRAA